MNIYQYNSKSGSLIFGMITRDGFLLYKLNNNLTRRGVGSSFINQIMVAKGVRSFRLELIY